MRTRPKLLNFSAISFILLSLWHFSTLELLPPSHQWLALSLGAGCILLAYLSLNASRLLILLAPAFIFGALWSSWALMNQRLESTTLTAMTILTYSGTLLTLTAVFSFDQVRHFFFYPVLRWWLTPARKKIRLHLSLRLFNGSQEVTARTFDVSEGGAFVPLNSTEFKDSLLRHLEANTRCLIRLSLGQFKHLDCTAKIVRRTEERGEYPSGFGLQFLNLTNKQKSCLTQYLRGI